MSSREGQQAAGWAAQGKLRPASSFVAAPAAPAPCDALAHPTASRLLGRPIPAPRSFTRTLILHNRSLRLHTHTNTHRALGTDKLAPTSRSPKSPRSLQAPPASRQPHQVRACVGGRGIAVHREKPAPTRRCRTPVARHAHACAQQRTTISPTLPASAGRGRNCLTFPRRRSRPPPRSCRLARDRHLPSHGRAPLQGAAQRRRGRVPRGAQGGVRQVFRRIPEALRPQRQGESGFEAPTRPPTVLPAPPPRRRRRRKQPSNRLTDSSSPAFLQDASGFWRDIAVGEYAWQTEPPADHHSENFDHRKASWMGWLLIELLPSVQLASTQRAPR